MFAPMPLLRGHSARDISCPDAGAEAGQCEGEGEFSNLAAEVLQLSDILAQDALTETGCYVFAEDGGQNGGPVPPLELSQDDTHDFIGVLNSSEVDIASRQLGVLLHRLDREAVEGLTRRLFTALKHRASEFHALESHIMSAKAPTLSALESPCGSPDSTHRPPVRRTSASSHGSGGPGGSRKRSASNAPALAAARTSRSESPGTAGEGRLAVRIVSAHELTNKDSGLFGDVSDPYAVARVGDQEQKTPVISNNLNPVWAADNEFIFALGKGDCILDLQVLNANNFLANPSLGSMRIDINQLRPGMWLRLREPLSDVPHGELEFDVYHAPCGKATMPDSPASVGQARSVRSSSAGTGAGAEDVFRRLSARPVLRTLPDVQLPTSPDDPHAAEGHSDASMNGACLASDYLGWVLQERERETGQPAALSRRGLVPDDVESSIGPQRRVREDEARKIFDRLYRTGKDHQTKRTTHIHLGQLAQECRDRETCPFEPNLHTQPAMQRLPSSGEDASRRLHQEATERKWRREQLARDCVQPSFHPQTTELANTLVAMRREQDMARMQELQHLPRGGYTISPRDTLGVGSVGDHSLDDDGCFAAHGTRAGSLPPPGPPSTGMHIEPPHERLFREHRERQARQAQREVEQAEWRKHPYHPEILSRRHGPWCASKLQTPSVTFDAEEQEEEEEEGSSPQDEDEQQPKPTGDNGIHEYSHCEANVTSETILNEANVVADADQAEDLVAQPSRPPAIDDEHGASVAPGYGSHRLVDWGASRGPGPPEVRVETAREINGVHKATAPKVVAPPLPPERRSSLVLMPQPANPGRAAATTSVTTVTTATATAAAAASTPAEAAAAAAAAASRAAAAAADASHSAATRRNGSASPSHPGGASSGTPVLPSQAEFAGPPPFVRVQQPGAAADTISQTDQRGRWPTEPPHHHSISREASAGPPPVRQYSGCVSSGYLRPPVRVAMPASGAATPMYPTGSLTLPTAMSPRSAASLPLTPQVPYATPCMASPPRAWSSTAPSLAPQSCAMGRSPSGVYVGQPQVALTPRVVVAAQHLPPQPHAGSGRAAISGGYPFGAPPMLSPRR